MDAEFTFQDYVVDGVNVIRLWLDSIPSKAKAKLNNRLLHLEGLPPGQWQRPLVDTLDEHCAGLFEIRASMSRRQYRILGYHASDRRPVLVHCFIKPGSKVPPGECDKALNRRASIEGRARGHTMTEHDYG